MSPLSNKTNTCFLPFKAGASSPKIRRRQIHFPAFEDETSELVLVPPSEIETDSLTLQLSSVKLGLKLSPSRTPIRLPMRPQRRSMNPLPVDFDVVPPHLGMPDL